MASTWESSEDGSLSCQLNNNLDAIKVSVNKEGCVSDSSQLLDMIDVVSSNTERIDRCDRFLDNETDLRMVQGLSTQRCVNKDEVNPIKESGGHDGRVRTSPTNHQSPEGSTVTSHHQENGACEVATPTCTSAESDLAPRTASGKDICVPMATIEAASSEKMVVMPRVKREDIDPPLGCPLVCSSLTDLHGWVDLLTADEGIIFDSNYYLNYRVFK